MPPSLLSHYSLPPTFVGRYLFTTTPTPGTMPAKAIPIIVAAVVATAIVIYDNREQIVDLYERGREKLAQSLHRFADSVGPRHLEAPHGYSGHSHEVRRQSFDERLRREEELEGFSQTYRDSPTATGRAHSNTPARYRHRNSVGTSSQHNIHRAQVLYDLSPSNKEIPLLPIRGANNTDTDTPTFSYEKDLPAPPLSPGHKLAPPQTELAPSESGYGSERTVLVSPPIKPQSSPFGKSIQHPDTPFTANPPVASPPFGLAIPIATVIVASPAIASRSIGIIPENAEVSAIPPSPPVLPQRPLSVHSSSESEPGIIPPNPFAPASPYMATQEWVNSTRSSGDTPSTPKGSSEAGSVAGEVVDIPEVESDFGSASDGEFDEAASWTEVGSQTSENDY